MMRHPAGCLSGVTLRVLIDPAQQQLDQLLGREGRRARERAGRGEEIAELAFMSAHVRCELAARVGEQLPLDELQLRRGALDIGQHRAHGAQPDHAGTCSKEGYCWAIGSPVNWATQPSGVVNSRMAVK